MAALDLTFSLAVGLTITNTLTGGDQGKGGGC